MIAGRLTDGELLRFWSCLLNASFARSVSPIPKFVFLGYIVRKMMLANSKWKASVDVTRRSPARCPKRPKIFRAYHRHSARYRGIIFLKLLDFLASNRCAATACSTRRAFRIMPSSVSARCRRRLLDSRPAEVSTISEVDTSSLSVAIPRSSRPRSFDAKRASASAYLRAAPSELYSFRP